MKRKPIWIAYILLLLLMAGCAKTYHGTDALLEKAREELPIADAENIELQYAGLCGRDEDALIWFISGNEYQHHTYLPMECVVVGKDAYTFTRTCKPLERGEDIAVLQWKGGYSFLVNNPACKSIQITDESGKVTEIVIEKGVYPYLYYHSVIPKEYLFLDAEGKELA